MPTVAQYTGHVGIGFRFTFSANTNSSYSMYINISDEENVVKYTTASWLSPKDSESARSAAEVARDSWLNTRFY